MNAEDVDQEAIDSSYQRLKREAEEGGYHLNPDVPFTKNLIRGLIVNDRRYGYPSCPCRLSMGRRELDRDIICPCDYRDPDLDQYGACYCALYVSGELLRGERELSPVPERRPPMAARSVQEQEQVLPPSSSLAWPVWRCRVCGYLCARTNPPEVCPICRAAKDRFERFL